MQVSPSPSLSHIVRHFLVLESGSPGTVSHRLFPDGNPGMVFHYGDPFIDSQQVKQPGSFVYGQISQFHNIVSAGRIGAVVVVLNPYGAFYLFGIPAFELNDIFVSLRDLWGREADLLEEQILGAPDNGTRIYRIETFLMGRLSKITGPDGLVKEAVRLIGQHHGTLKMAELNALLQSDERGLERKFLKNVGVSPKYFSNTIRLQYFIKLLQHADSRVSLTSLVYECGYYDQAHSIREFRKNTGLTPRQYVSAKNLLAANFFQFSSSGR